MQSKQAELQAFAEVYRQPLFENIPFKGDSYATAESFEAWPAFLNRPGGKPAAGADLPFNTFTAEALAAGLFIGLRTPE